MNQKDYKKAVTLIGKYADRMETSALYSGGQRITVHWLNGGGQRAYYTLEQVEGDIEEIEIARAYREDSRETKRRTSNERR